MFQRFRSFRAKITALATVTTAVALVLALGIVITTEYADARASALRNAMVAADIAAEGCAAALLFDDREAAEQTLEILRVEENVLYAAVWRSDGSKLAAMNRGDAEVSQHSQVPGLGHEFVSNTLMVTRPIILEADALGVIHLHYDLRPLRARLAEQSLLLLGVMLVATLLAWFVARHLQRHISEPVQRLVETAKAVSVQQDYSLRAEKLSRDEFGDLTEAFNDMLVQIESRDAALGRARTGLEERVQERTAELEKAYLTLQGEMDEREKAQAESQQAQALLLASIEQSPAGILVADAPDGRIRIANSAALGVRGVTGDPLVGIPSESHFNWECHHPDGTVYDPADLPLSRALTVGETVKNMEVVVQREDGSERWISANAAPVRNDRGEITAGVVVFLDITEQKRIQGEQKEMQSKLVETSRLAGMAEVATGVLHNVGNVLNSVNVSATLITDRVQKLALGDLAAVVELLQSHRETLASYLTEDERGRLIPDFLAELSQSFQTDNETVLEEVQALNSSIAHIKDVISTQQSYAKISGATEPLNLRDLLEDAIRINEGGFRRHSVQLVREFEEVPIVITDRHKVLQIVINLLGNAKYALSEQDPANRLLRIQLQRPPDDEETVVIRVIDNGVGIPAENMRKIFTHGFTTRRDGHGFGLHSGALSASILGGSLSAASDGLGCGASFALELPVRLERSAA
jgi:PAS domain S-box-containing protein